MPIIQDLSIENCGSFEVRMRNVVVQDNIPVLRKAEFLRSLPKGQEQGFLSRCRVVACLPVYFPRGTFKGDSVHVHNADDDQIEHVLRKYPEFRTVEEKPKALTQFYDMGRREHDVIAKK